MKGGSTGLRLLLFSIWIYNEKIILIRVINVKIIPPSPEIKMSLSLNSNLSKGKGSKKITNKKIPKLMLKKRPILSFNN
jgi:hypothetical protein